MGGLAGYITEGGMSDVNRMRLLQALPATEGETPRFFTEGAATFLYTGEAGSENAPLSQRRGEQVLSAVLNGHLSNSAALRDRLRRRGHPLHTGFDAELVLISYIEWGKDAPEHFSGDFALAVWNGRELFLARSQTGRKSMFFTCRNGFPLFASDPAVLFAHPGPPLRLSPQDAVRLLCPGKKDICEPTVPMGIEALQPGAFLLWRQGQETQRGMFKDEPTDEADFPGRNFPSLFESRLRTILTEDGQAAECCLALEGKDSLAEWIQNLSGGRLECRRLAIWEEGAGICPDATTITGQEAALGLTEPVTALGRVDFTPDEAAAYRLCRRAQRSFSSAISAAGGYLLLAGHPQPPTAIPSEWLVPELRRITDIPSNREDPDRLLQKSLRSLFERNDRLASHAGLRLIFPFADSELMHLCSLASRQKTAEFLDRLSSPRFWPHPDGRDWAHGAECRFRALLARSDAPIWQLCCRNALPIGEIHPEAMAKLVTVGHWLERFKIAPG